MNYKAMVKGALALSLGLIAGVASASSVQKYGATFEETISQIVGSMNDHAYTNNMPISDPTLRDTANGVGWFVGGEDDASAISNRTDGASGQSLHLSTESFTLTNKLASATASAVNAGIAAHGAYFETEVKFVASDTLDAGIDGGQDATKFAIYAYCDGEEGSTTNLVVFHAVMDADTGVISYVNEVFDTLIDTEVYTKLRINMKKLTDPLDPEAVYNVFSVSVDNGAALSSSLAIDAVFDETETGTWFLTAENIYNDADKLVTSLTFRGTGEIDNINVGVITDSSVTYEITASVTGGTISTNGVAAAAGTYVLCEGDSVVFSPMAGYALESVTVNGVVVSDATSPYTYTVGNADATVSVVFVEASSDDYAADEDVGGTTISAAMASWLNNLKNAAGMTKAEYTAAIAADTDALSLMEEYLLNTDPTVNTTVEFQISSITAGDTIDVQIALTRSESGAAVTAAINGTLKIYGAATVDGAYAEDQVLTDTFNGTTTATKSFETVNRFFKAVIE